MLRAVDRLGQKIKDARQVLGMTIRGLAEAMDVSETTVKNWEAGTTPRDRIARLERVLQTSLRDQPDRGPSMEAASVPAILLHLGTRWAKMEELLRRRDETIERLRADAARQLDAEVGEHQAVVRNLRPPTGRELSQPWAARDLTGEPEYQADQHGDDPGAAP